MIILFLLFGLLTGANSQIDKTRLFSGHSHNDYLQERPFYTAWENYFGSIEADVWAIDGKLFVAHQRNEINEERTLQNLYLKPIQNVFIDNNSRIWNDFDESLIFIIDLKSGYDSTLHDLLLALEPYKFIFDSKINPYAVKIVISGNMPPPELFDTYPEYITFDGRMENNYTARQLERIILFSNSIFDYVKRDFNGNLSADEESNLKYYLLKAHQLGKKVRFWNIPDQPEVWKNFYKMGVDLINTDSPELFSKTMYQKF